MLTETIISKLAADATLRGLLGASSANDVPIQAGFTKGEVVTYLIAVDTVMGETEEVGCYEHGILTIEIYVKSNINAPVKKVTDIAKRIVALLDLKGSSLNDSYTTVVYRLRKTSYVTDFDDVAQSHLGTIDFEFYSSRSI